MIYLVNIHCLEENKDKYYFKLIHPCPKCGVKPELKKVYFDLLDYQCPVCLYTPIKYFVECSVSVLDALNIWNKGVRE